ncbi:MAG: Ig-like domain repeat protein [Ruminococcus sp.]|nr:Ig-like domain repeat protein [Ruminococcus sp.]
MDKKKEMLRRAAAFVSALSFLSVSNMGAFSAFAAENGTQPAASSSTPAEEGDSPAKAGTTTTTTTTSTTTVTTTTTAPDVETSVKFPSGMDTNKIKILRDAIFDRLNRNGARYMFVELDNDDAPTKLIIKYRPENKADIVNALNDPFDYPDNHSGDDYYDRYTVDIDNEAITLKVIYRVDIKEEWNSVDKDKFIQKDGRYYIGEDSVINSTFFDLGDFRFAEGSGKVSGVVTIDKEGVTTGGNRIVEFKDKKFAVDISLANATINGNDSVRFEYKWSELESKQVRIKSVNGSVKFRVKGKTDKDDKVYSFNGYEKNINVKDLIASFLTVTDDKVEYIHDAVYNVEIVGIPNSIIASNTFIRDDDEETKNEELTLNTNYEVEIPYIIQDENGITYYLSYYEFMHIGLGRFENHVTKEFPTYKDIETEISKNGIVKKIAWENGFKEVGNNGEYFVLKYKQIADAETAGVKIMDKVFAKAGDSAHMRNSNVIGIAKPTRFSVNFGENSEFEGCKFNFSTEDGGYASMSVTEGVLEGYDLSGNEYIQFLTLENADGVIVPMEQFYIYLDNSAPKVNIIDKEGSGWKQKRSFRVEITDNSGDGNVDSVIKDDECNSIGKISVGGAVFEKATGEKWVIGKKYSKPADVAEGETGYTVALTPVKDDNDKTVFDVEINVSSTSGETINSSITVSAEDYAKKKGEASIQANIDYTKPKLTAFTLKGINEHFIIENSKRTLSLTASATDKISSDQAFSGLKNSESVVFHYETATTPSRFTYEHSQAVNCNDSGTAAASLDLNNYEQDGYLVIDVIDNAGNTQYYYYSKDGGELNATTASSKATLIRSDTSAPELPVLTPDFGSAKRKEIEENGKKKLWLSDYPQISFSSADDTNGTGIEKIEIRINGITKEIKLSDLTSDDTGFDPAKELENGNFTITFTKDASDKTTYTPHLVVDGYTLDTDPLAGNKLSLPKSGELTVFVSSWDMGGNRCYGDGKNEASLTYYVDVTAPTVEPTFEADPADSINSPKYGNFSNHSVKLKIPVKDTGLNDAVVGSSGFDHAVVEIDYNNHDNSGGTERITVEESDIRDGYIYVTVPGEEVAEGSAKSLVVSVTAYDKVGNKSETVVVQKNEHDLVIDRKAPDFGEFEIKPANEGENIVRTTVGDKLWVSGDVAVSCEITDEDSGLASVKTAGGKEDFDKNYTDDSNILTGEVYTSYTAPDKDGRFEFEFNATDNAGNSDNRKKEIYKDNKRPEITGFVFRKSDNLGKDNMVDGSYREKYRNFYNDNDGVEMIVTAEDPMESSGIKNICIVLYNPDGTVYGERTVEFNDGERVHEASYFIPEGFKGDIVAWAVDNVEWESDKKSPNGYISENDEHHNNTAEVRIERPSTDKKDNKGRDLYNSEVELTVTVSDPQTGVRDIEWAAPDKSGKVEIDNEGSLVNDSSDDSKWTSDDNDKERNILTKAVKKIVVSKNDNGNEVSVLMHDYAGNLKDNKDEFSIDTRRPTIKVDGIPESDKVVYYNTHKTAKVTIVERNFTAPVVNGSADTGFVHDGSTPDDSESTAYVKEFSFNSDGRYTLDIAETDLAGNAAEKEYHSGVFVVDTTDPKAHINVNKSGGGTVKTGDNAYVDSDVSVAVTVDEVNFDPNSTEITINGKAFTPGSWSSGGSHTAVIPEANFSKDGQYTISVSGKDLAGNALKPVTASFTVDKKKPEIKITGVSSANNGDVAPVINITDDNLDAQDVKVYRNGQLLSSTVDKKGEVVSYEVKDGKTITGRWLTENYEKGIKKKMVFDNFPSEEEYDGSYRIDVESTDMAENENAESLDFSVNRFGSVFTIEKAEEINGKYLNKAPTVVITETNVDKHSSDDEVVIIVDKGTSTVELTDKQYVVTGPEELSDKSGYKYTYTIDPKNFDQDLDYNISIQSVDAAGNKNVSSGRGADLSFSIDTHEPEFKCDELIDRAEFKESEREFKLNVNERLKHVKVTTSLDEVLLDRDGNEGGDNSYTFAVPASNTSRDLTVELTDLAGNSTKKTYKNLLITENIALYVMHKTWAKTGAAVAAALAAAAGGVVLVKKRKNK